MKCAKRRDENERSIISALRSVGAQVWPLNERDLPDLMVGFRGAFHLLEVKGEAGPRGGTDDRNLRPGQARFFEEAHVGCLPVYLVRNSNEALKAIGVDLVGVGR